MPPYKGRQHLMVARVSTVAFQGIETLDVDVQVQTSAGLPTSPLSACPTRRWAKAARGYAEPFTPWAWRCPTSASPSIWRPPIC